MIDIEGITIDDYKFVKSFYGKLYYTRISYGIPRQVRYLRKPSATATKALEYGQRFLDRYKRLKQACVVSVV